jgi:hypothetical protein
MQALCCGLCRTFSRLTGHGAKHMTQIMIVLVELKFDGIIILDRAPAVEDGHGPEQA